VVAQPVVAASYPEAVREEASFPVGVEEASLEDRLPVIAAGEQIPHD
tara:strand:+ start:2467 stop:2607 length:141 start_codon:yes stop_codon:yes gene_type:complete